jgi:hypothetical protein
MTECQSARLCWCHAPIWGPRPNLYYFQTVTALLMWGDLSDEATGLSFAIAVGLHQHSHFRVGVPQDTVSDSRLPQPGGPGPRIYIPQEQGGPVIPPGTGFSLRRLLWLAGLRWSYSNPPPLGGSNNNSKLLYDRLFIANQFILSPNPLRITIRGFFFNWTLAAIVLELLVLNNIIFQHPANLQMNTRRTHTH